jgi:uroporphyrinogen-III synthase
LAEALDAAGFAVRRRVVYRAVAGERLPAAVAAALASGAVGAVLLFSPRTATIFVGLVSGLPAEAGLAVTEAWCLSAAVAQAAADLPWRVRKVAPEPTVDAMLELAEPPRSA